MQSGQKDKFSFVFLFEGYRFGRYFSPSPATDRIKRIFTGNLFLPSIHRINSLPENKIFGSIEYIVSEVGPEGFARIICNLQQGSDLLIPGMYINADIESKTRDAWVVPEEAVVNFEGKEFIFIETSDGKFEQTEAITGRKEKGKTEIVNYEYFKGKNLVFKNAYTILMKMKNVSDE